MKKNLDVAIVKGFIKISIVVGMQLMAELKLII